jgi:type IV pilus assembly protein PilM
VFKRAGIRSKRAYISVANQRVVVRQVDLPHLDEKEFRSSLRFQVADHIPMAVEDAELDYRIVEEFETEDGQEMMRVQLMAAARDMVERFVDTVVQAGVEPLGVDLTPFAIARAVSPAARGEEGRGGAEAVIDVGAGVTNILVHHNGEPRFVRILLVGGDDTTAGLVRELGVGFDEAEAIKLDLGRGVGGHEAARVVEERVRALVEEIRGSLDYYLTQEGSVPISSLLLTGGGSLTQGFVRGLQDASPAPLRRGTPLASLRAGRSGLDDEQMEAIEPVAGAAVGIALGALQR